MKPESVKEEYKEVEQQLSNNGSRELAPCVRLRSILQSIISPIFFEVFAMTFLAEWGDRSQITTIVLAAREVRHPDLLYMLTKSKPLYQICICPTF